MHYPYIKKNISYLWFVLIGADSLFFFLPLFVWCYHQIYSNGKYKSVLHRALVNEAKIRVSVASLHSLPFNCTVRPSPKLVDEANPKRYMDTDFDSFLAYVSTRETKKKDFLETRRLIHT